jgi:hypothetical protein
LQTDPIGFQAGDINLYLYGENSSINLSDPTGLFSLWPFKKNDIRKIEKEIEKEAEEKLKNKAKEWYLQQVGGKSVQDAACACDSIKKVCPGDRDANWAADCITCAIYQIALNFRSIIAAKTELEMRMVRCNSLENPNN